ncbi:hypothetical protein ACFQ9V_00910 [Leifsonia sp. NPDC056665]|uniref:hypothetical protein n=1 Tax=Leifsonia sp. NPDC056665 TaxID=3345901 RepID=UPI0036864D06
MNETWAFLDEPSAAKYGRGLTALLRPLTASMVIGTCNWTSNTEHFVGLVEVKR